MFPKFVLTNLVGDWLDKNDVNQMILVSDILTAKANFNKSIREHRWVLMKEDIQLLRNVYQVGELFASKIIPAERTETAKGSAEWLLTAVPPYADSLVAEATTIKYNNPAYFLYLAKIVNVMELKYTVANWTQFFPENAVLRLQEKLLWLYLATVLAFSKHGHCTNGRLLKLHHILLKIYKKEFNDLNITLVAKIWTEYGQYVDDHTIRDLFAKWNYIVLPNQSSVELWNAVLQIAWCDFADYKLVTDSLRACLDFPWNRLAQIIPEDFANYVKVARAVGNRAWYNFDRATSDVAGIRFHGLTYCAKQLFIFTFGEEMLPSEIIVSSSKDVDPLQKRTIQGLVGWYIFRRLRGRNTQEEGDMTDELRAFIKALPDLEDTQLKYDSAGLPNYVKTTA